MKSVIWDYSMILENYRIYFVSESSSKLSLNRVKVSFSRGENQDLMLKMGKKIGSERQKLGS